MKLAMLGPYPIDKGVNSIRGGVQAVIVNMVKGLSRFRGLDVHIVTASDDIDKAIDFKSNGINIHAVPSDKSFGNVTLYRKVRKRISVKINQIGPDLIHTHSLGYYTLSALESGHKKIVVSTHGMSDRDWKTFRGLKEKVRRCIQYRINKKCMDKARNIIVNSPYAKECLCKLKDKNIYELDNPVSESFFELSNDFEEKGRLLFVGNILREKGIMTLLYSLKMLKESFDGIKLMLAGQVNDKSFYSELVKFIENNRLTKHAHFLGHLKEGELREEYKKASIFVFPSQKDVAPLVVLQAMASRKAIVASRVGGIPYIIDDGINGFLVDKENHGMFSDKTALFIKDSALRRKFGLNARRKAFDNYRIDKIAARLYEIYGEVMR